MNSVEKLIIEVKNHHKDIGNKLNEIEKIKASIKEKEKILWKSCDHKWKRDWDVAFDDHIKYYCEKCSLWKCRYMYE